MNFPADLLKQVEISENINDCFNIKPALAFKGKTDHMLVFKHEDEIRDIIPAYDNILKLKGRGVIITAKGVKADFVSRFFAPQAGVDEDPVTGSAHTSLTPYWAGELGKAELTAIQLSSRKGYLQCSYLDNRVDITGKARLCLTGEIFLE
jgi:predicted PhzF superfamily epimerase YddE/YHI9